MIGKITVVQAAKIVGVSQETLRYMMKNQLINIGLVIQKKRPVFVIQPPLLASYKGCSMEELESYIKNQKGAKNYGKN